ncbi:hypothetical protein A0256_03130 [Mucilaginibacter sp. PAMC 26640]|nr:hypothetical protein A0256_03130 [Mucilaginibacter sp. PAMC 26640]
MTTRASLIICGILLVAACKKEENKPTIITVNVRSVSGQALSDVSVKLLPEKSINAVATEVAGADGKITFIVQPATTYYLYHYGSDQRSPDNSTSIFIVTGKFTTQEQINGSPRQTPLANLGDDIHLDINRDGVVDKYDKVVKVGPVNVGTTTAINFILNP